MMADTQSSAPLHPAPARHRVSQGIMLFALIAAPVSWLFQTISNMAIARHACFPKDAPLVFPAFDYAADLMIFITGMALLVALAGLVASIGAWRQTRGEAHGNGHKLLDIGEGRTRFLAMCALILSIGFSIALCFAVVPLVIVRLC